MGAGYLLERHRSEDQKLSFLDTGIITILSQNCNTIVLRFRIHSWMVPFQRENVIRSERACEYVTSNPALRFCSQKCSENFSLVTDVGAFQGGWK